MTENSISIIEMHYEKTKEGIPLLGAGATTEGIIR